MPRSRRQIARLPHCLVGGGSNAIGLFAPFYDDKEVKMIGVNQQAADLIPLTMQNTYTWNSGIIHGFKCKVIQDENGEPAPVYSISAGLDYPGVGPEHCYYQATGRAEYVTATDKEAIDAFLTLSKVEGIIPAIESSHAVAAALRLAPTLDKDKIIVVNLSGRGDKDVAEIARILGRD